MIYFYGFNLILATLNLANALQQHTDWKPWVCAFCGWLCAMIAESKNN